MSNAMNTAIELCRLWQTELFFDGGNLLTRCGVNKGKIVVGAIGSKDRLIFTIQGGDANIVTRLGQLNKQYDSYI